MDRNDSLSLHLLLDDYLHDNTNTSTATSNTTTSELNNNHAAQNDNNVSFNSSSLSSYSAEEEIIQQRGRRSPMKNSSNNNLHHPLTQQQLNNYFNNRDLFLSIKEKSMQSPDSKTIDYNNISSIDSRNIDLSQDIVETSQLSSLSSAEGGGETVASSKKSKRNLNKSLLRTPVKRRLRIRTQSSGRIRKLIHDKRYC